MVRTDHSLDPNGGHNTSVISFEIMGVGASITTESWEEHRVLSSPQGHGEIVSIQSEVSGVAGGFPLPDSSIETSYNPALYIGPFTRWCDGETWVTPSVTQTITTDPGGTITEPTEPLTGIVESVGESLTTDAGTFDCVRSKTTITGGPDEGDWTRQWISKDLGVLIKMEIHASGSGGEIIGFLEATSID
jgi:hypothetical protein